MERFQERFSVGKHHVRGLLSCITVVAVIGYSALFLIDFGGMTLLPPEFGRAVVQNGFYSLLIRICRAFFTPVLGHPHTWLGFWAATIFASIAWGAILYAPAYLFRTFRRRPVPGF